MAMVATMASAFSSSLLLSSPPPVSPSPSTPASSSSSSAAAVKASPSTLPTEVLAVRKPLQARRGMNSIGTKTGLLRFKSLSTRAASSEETTTEVSKQVEDIFADIKEKWDAVENKSTVLVYGGGAVLALWLSSIVVGAVNSVPLLPKLLELIGLGYTGWFTYRYLLFKSSRKELVADIEELKKKITGTEE